MQTLRFLMYIFTTGQDNMIRKNTAEAGFEM